MSGACSSADHAQSARKRNKPVEFIVGFAHGSSTDETARTMRKKDYKQPKALLGELGMVK